jgi:hypothetical protein
MCEAWNQWHEDNDVRRRRYDAAEARAALLGPAGQGFFYQSGSPANDSMKLMSLRCAALKGPVQQQHLHGAWDPLATCHTAIGPTGDLSHCHWTAEA